MMTPNEFAVEMIKARDLYKGNIEAQHQRWDKLMEDLLMELGYKEGVKIARDGNKAYSKDCTQWDTRWGIHIRTRDD